MIRIILSLSLISFFAFAKPFDISKSFFYPKSGGMGDSGIASYGDPYSSNLNPASLATYHGWNSHWHNYIFENDLSHQQTALSWKIFDDYILGLGISSQSLGKIPNTQLINERIRENGYFSEWNNSWEINLAKKIKNLLLFKDLDLGVAVNIQNYSYLNQTDFYTKFGIIGKLNNLENFYFGLVINDASETNLFDFGITYKEDSHQINFDLKNEKIQMGFEYSINDYLHLRTGANPDYLTLGAGLFYDRLYAGATPIFGLQVDYAFKIPINDKIYEQVQYIGFSIKEQERLIPPIFYKYPFYTNQKTAQILGWGPKDSTILLFNEKNQIDKINTDHKGMWETKVSLTNGINNFKAKAIDRKNKKESDFTKFHSIITDYTKPNFKYFALIKNELSNFLEIIPNEKLRNSSFISNLNKNEEELIPSNNHFLSYQISKDELNNFGIKITDLAGNINDTKIKNRLPEITSPLSLRMLTNKDKYLFSGKANIYRKTSITNLNNQHQELINAQTFKKDYSSIIPLVYGENIIHLTDEDDISKLIIEYRVFRIFEHKDINNKEIDLMATLKIIPQEKLFRPEAKIKQKEAISYLYSLLFQNQESLSKIYSWGLKNNWIQEESPEKLLTIRESLRIIADALSLDTYTIHPKSEQWYPDKLTKYYLDRNLITMTMADNQEQLITKYEFISILSKTDLFKKIKVVNDLNY